MDAQARIRRQATSVGVVGAAVVGAKRVIGKRRWGALWQHGSAVVASYCIGNGNAFEDCLRPTVHCSTTSPLKIYVLGNVAFSREKVAPCCTDFLVDNQAIGEFRAKMVLMRDEVVVKITAYE